MDERTAAVRDACIIDAERLACAMGIARAKELAARREAESDSAAGLKRGGAFAPRDATGKPLPQPTGNFVPAQAAGRRGCGGGPIAAVGAIALAIALLSCMAFTAMEKAESDAAAQADVVAAAQPATEPTNPIEL